MRFLIYTIFITFISCLDAAGPMTHLYFAEYFCRVHGICKEKSVREFMVGTLFPDIRYIAHIPREATHFPLEGLKDVLQEEDLFRAGMKFHAWVDIVREEIVVSSGIYEAVAPHAEGRDATFLKFIEEEILADCYDGRKWSYCFDSPLAEEKLFVGSDEVLAKWHYILQYSMGYRPSWLFWGASWLRPTLMSIPASTIYNWSYALPKLAKEHRFQEHVQKMHEKILEAICTCR
jgi:hypothetical protein